MLREVFYKVCLFRLSLESYGFVEVELHGSLIFVGVSNILMAKDRDWVPFLFHVMLPFCDFSFCL